jgi:hypothetical protein
MTIDKQVQLILKHVKEKFKYDGVQIRINNDGSYYLTFEYNMTYTEFENYAGTPEIHPHTQTLLLFIRNYLGIDVNHPSNTPSVHVFSGINLLFNCESEKEHFYSSLGTFSYENDISYSTLK